MYINIIGKEYFNYKPKCNKSACIEVNILSTKAFASVDCITYQKFHECSVKDIKENWLFSYLNIQIFAIIRRIRKYKIYRDYAKICRIRQANASFLGTIHGQHLPSSWTRSRRRGRWAFAFCSAFQRAFPATIRPGRKFTIDTARRSAAGKTISRRPGATWFSHSRFRLLAERESRSSRTYTHVHTHKRTVVVQPPYHLTGYRGYRPSSNRILCLASRVPPLPEDDASPNACLGIPREIFEARAELFFPQVQNTRSSSFPDGCSLSSGVSRTERFYFFGWEKYRLRTRTQEVNFQVTAFIRFTEFALFRSTSYNVSVFVKYLLKYLSFFFLIRTDIEGTHSTKK